MYSCASVSLARGPKDCMHMVVRNYLAVASRSRNTNLGLVWTMSISSTETSNDSLEKLELTESQESVIGSIWKRPEPTQGRGKVFLLRRAAVIDV